MRRRRVIPSKISRRAPTPASNISGNSRRRKRDRFSLAFAPSSNLRPSMKGYIMRFIKKPARFAPLLLALGAAGCSDFLDVNKNPNAPENAAIDIRLAGLETAFIHSTYYGSVALWGSEWTQQWAFNATRRSYSQAQNYELFDTDAASSWNYM